MLIGLLMLKKGTFTKPFIEFIFSSKSIFSFFVQKNGPINVESHTYKMTNLDGTYFSKTF